MHGADRLWWLWIALAVVAGVAAACGGDAEEQSGVAVAPPSAEQAAVASEGDQPQAAEQPSAGEPIQWSSDRCFVRLGDSRLFHDSLQVDFTGIQREVRLGETARARYLWETLIQPTLDELTLADQELADHCRDESFEEYLELSEDLRRFAEEELATISANRQEFDPGAAGWTAEQCDRRFQDVVIYSVALLDYALVDLEGAVNRGDSALARRIGETRIEPAIDELRDAFGDVSEHCERLPASEAEIGDTFEGLLQFGQDLLDEVEQRYAELAE